jgi:hypothetical protein
MSSFLFRLFHFTQMVFDKLKLNPSFSILDQQEHPLGYNSDGVWTRFSLYSCLMANHTG